MINKIMNAIKTILVIENKQSLNICKDKITKILASNESLSVRDNEQAKETKSFLNIKDGDVCKVRFRVSKFQPKITLDFDD